VTNDQARGIVTGVLLRIVPDADFDTLGPDADLRDELELDSLDFLSFVEALSKQTGVRIDEVDYPKLQTLASSTAFLSARG